MLSRWAENFRRGPRWQYEEYYPEYEEPVSYAPYGGYGYTPSGGGGYKKEPPKQYGNVRTTGERNPPQWLMDMMVWNI
jgi:hypothetical protein